MPELPDITIYIEALEARIRSATLERVRLASPFVLRSFDPPISEANGREDRQHQRPPAVGTPLVAPVPVT